MGMRRLVALLWLVAACPAKSTVPATSATPSKPSAGSANTATPATGSGSATTTPAPPPGPPPGPTSNATLTEAGIEATALDRSVDPCVDFYQFACGGWIATNKIPEDRATWDRMAELTEKTLASLQILLDEAAKKPGDKVGDFYASCMDEAAIENAGTAPIKALLAKTQGVKDAKSWFAALTELHRVGIWVVWNSIADADLGDATKNVTWLDGAGLGLPDRDYYDKPEHASTLASYKEHVQRMLALGGIAKPDVAAADVLAIETALAKVTKTAVEKRDPQAMNNPFDMKGLAKLTKSIDWKAYFKAFGVTPSARMLVASPKFFAALDGLRKDYKPAQWASYFTYHLLVESGFELPKAFDDEAFALERLVRGTPDKQTRAKRCSQATAAVLGEVLAKQYVDKHFPPAAKTSAEALFEAVRTAMNEELANLDWMSPATRKIAQDKLAKIVAMIGYPAKWRSYDFTVKRDDFGGNVQRGRAFDTKRTLAKSGKPVDRGEWFLNAFETEAYYNPAANNSAILAGILQGVYFGADRSVAANLGGIGIVIGHELTHGFDDTGAQFDAAGNLKNWWTPEDKAKFEAKGACVADQYSSFEAAPKQFVNGKLTLGENIADLGGTKMAFKAYRQLRKDASPAIVADGFTEDQIFFLSAAQLWCSRQRPAELQRHLTTNPHSPAKFRIYGELRNLPEFAQAFSCKAGTPMHPAQTCSVW